MTNTPQLWRCLSYELQVLCPSLDWMHRRREYLIWLNQDKPCTTTPFSYSYGATTVASMAKLRECNPLAYCAA